MRDPNPIASEIYASAMLCAYIRPHTLHFARQLYGQLCTTDFRPDLLLRKIALLAIECNPDQYQSFLLSANAKTRHQQKVGGAAVKLNRYIKRMSDPRCDGDAVTLQALSDALSVSIFITKFIPELEKVIVHEVLPRVIDLGEGIRQQQSLMRGGKSSIWISLRGEAHYRSIHLAAESVASTPRSTRFVTKPASVSALQFAIESFSKLRATLEEERAKAAEELVCCMCFERVPADDSDASTNNSCSHADSDGSCSGVRGTLDCCDHLFHFSCIMEWSKMSNSCPVCRRRFAKVKKAGRERAVKVKFAERRGQAEDEDEESAQIRAREMEAACIVCGSASFEENLMLCDGHCGTACHAFCIGLDAVPEGDWFCSRCSRQRRTRRQSNLATAMPSPPAHPTTRGRPSLSVPIDTSNDAACASDEESSSSRNGGGKWRSMNAREKKMQLRVLECLRRMRLAAISDERAHRMGLLTMQKPKLMDSLVLLVSEGRETSTMLLDMGLLKVLQRWIRPYGSDGSLLLPGDMRRQLLQMVLELPVTFEHIRNSNSFGKLLMKFVGLDRDVVQQIVRKWSHLASTRDFYRKPSVRKTYKIKKRNAAG
eukprot:g2343.t1